MPRSAVAYSIEDSAAMASELSGDDCSEHDDGRMGESVPNMIESDFEGAIALDPAPDPDAEEFAVPPDGVPAEAHSSRDGGRGCGCGHDQGRIRRWRRRCVGPAL